MSKRIRLTIFLVLLLAVTVGTAQAQDDPRPTPTNIAPITTTGDLADGPRGSIRGTVFKDVNADGKCSEDPVLAGIPIKFYNDLQEGTTVYLQSGENGTYGLVAAGLGTWQVTAEPPAGYVVTSKQPLEVYLGPEDENRLVLNVNFCVAEGTAVTTSGDGHGVILPTAGAAVAPALSMAMLTGLSMMGLGVGLEWRRRRSK